jgi:hypothetical protein
MATRPTIEERVRTGFPIVHVAKRQYWIQLADFSAKDYPPVDLLEAERLLTSYDWQTALAFKRALARSRGEESGDYCMPGIGFVTDDGRLLHICPTDDGTALCTYFLTFDFNDAARKGFETLDSSKRLWSKFLPLVHQYRALQLFYRDDFDGLIRLIDEYDDGSFP